LYNRTPPLREAQNKKKTSCMKTGANLINKALDKATGKKASGASHSTRLEKVIMINKFII
jgi:hypothetical protein